MQRTHVVSNGDMFARYKIAVLLPCYNEEIAIDKVVCDFRAALPQAVIYVYDDDSSDRTAGGAVEAGVVPRLPVAVLAMGLMLLAFLLFAPGLVLDTVTRGRRETRLLAYLARRPLAEL